MLIFEPCGDGREVARLGGIMVGEVALNPSGRRVQAWARVYLPDVPMRTRAVPATSIDAAKRIIGKTVEEWLEAANLVVGR